MRPEDYHPSRLAHQGALSFHKFDDTDPVNTYNTWFKAHDEHLKPKQNQEEEEVLAKQEVKESQEPNQNKLEEKESEKQFKDEILHVEL